MIPINKEPIKIFPIDVKTGRKEKNIIIINIKKRSINRNIKREYILIPVGIAIIDVAEVKYDLVSISNPTINIWCPQTIQPIRPIIHKAINIESLPKIKQRINLENISLINPKAGKIKIYTSGWPKNQNKCWNKIRSPPRNGSKKEELKWRS